MPCPTMVLNDGPAGSLCRSTHPGRAHAPCGSSRSGRGRRFLAEHADLNTEDGFRRIVRPEHLPKHTTGTGFVSVRQRQLHDREVADDSPGRIRFCKKVSPMSFSASLSSLCTSSCSPSGRSLCSRLCAVDGRCTQQLDYPLRLNNLHWRAWDVIAWGQHVGLVRQQ
jgi:hypothetical protein